MHCNKLIRRLSSALYDMNITPTREPFKRLLTQGMVLGRTHRSCADGRYLKPHEYELLADGGAVEKETQQPTHVSWEKMSKVNRML